MFPRQVRRRHAGWLTVAAVVLMAVPSCTSTRPGPGPVAQSAGRSTAASAAAPLSTTGAGPGPTPTASPPSTTGGPSSQSTTGGPSSQPTTGGPSSQPTTGGPSSQPATAARSSTTPTPSTANGGSCVAGSCYRPGEIRELPDGVAPESSGIAASATMPGTFFVVDDGTGTSEIVAVHSDGSLVARVGVTGMSARNAEALSAGPCGSLAGRCLYVGDIGDNRAGRKNITVYRVEEPALSPPPRAPLAADSWRYTYPDGPHNAEAMVVLPDGSLLILTKSAPDATGGQVPAHRIYRAPAGGGRLTFVSSYRPPDPAAAIQSLFTGTVVTDASYTAGRMLLLTYDEVVEYRAPRPGADPATFPSWPHSELPAPAMIQSEGITADLTGCGYEVTSEEGPDGSRAGLAGVACS